MDLQVRPRPSPLPLGEGQGEGAQVLSPLPAAGEGPGVRGRPRQFCPAARNLVPRLQPANALPRGARLAARLRASSRYFLRGPRAAQPPPNSFPSNDLPRATVATTRLRTCAILRASPHPGGTNCALPPAEPSAATPSRPTPFV